MVTIRERTSGTRSIRDAGVACRTASTPLPKARLLEGDLEGARQALESYPGEPYERMAYIWSGYHYVAREFDEAIAAFERAVESSGRSPMMLAALVVLTMLLLLNRRMAQIERAGIQVNELLISREENTVYLNSMGFRLTPAAMETLAALAEARMDDDVLSGAEIEAVISGRHSSDCDEAAGATRIKRLRDTLGNQMISELLVKNIAKRGYVLAISKDVIRMV